ncbi:MAG TPA: hypothetical protein VGN78_13105 [Solirubrobacteraceae bacterium]|nr:hypothetical protein [Solirubrobacteraceae bacterium]
MTRSEVHPTTLSAGALLRRGWIVLLCAAIAGAAAYGISRLRHDQYTSEAVAVVPAGKLGNANDATKLAITYAGVIPSDQRVLQRVAAATRRPVSDVANRVTVVNDTDAAVLRLRYKGDDPGSALRGAQALAAAVTQRPAASPNLPARSLSLVRPPRRPAAAVPASSVAVPVGVVLGIVLGIVLLLAWERSDGRIGRREELSDVLAVPGSALDDLPEPAVGALLERWTRLAEAPSPRIGIVPLTSDLFGAARHAAIRIQAGAGSIGRWVSIVEAGDAAAMVSTMQSNGHGHADSSEPPDAATLVVGGAPESAAAGEALALSCDLIVVVASPGSRVRRVRSAAAVLRRFGVRPAWALLIKDGPLTRRRHRAADRELVHTG